MNPKEKALEIANAMYNGSVFDKTKEQHLLELENAKRCALIAVDEIIQEYQSMSDSESILVINNEITFVVKRLVYWMDVKNKINNL